MLQQMDLRLMHCAGGLVSIFLAPGPVLLGIAAGLLAWNGAAALTTALWSSHLGRRCTPRKSALQQWAQPPGMVPAAVAVCMPSSSSRVLEHGAHCWTVLEMHQTFHCRAAFHCVLGTGRGVRHGVCLALGVTAAGSAFDEAQVGGRSWWESTALAAILC